MVLPLRLEAGASTLTVRATDSDGASTLQRLVLHGVTPEPDPAADLGG
jgi:hypothetical protein